SETGGRRSAGDVQPRDDRIFQRRSRQPAISNFSSFPLLSDKRKLHLGDREDGWRDARPQDQKSSGRGDEPASLFDQRPSVDPGNGFLGSFELLARRLSGGDDHGYGFLSECELSYDSRHG